MTDYADLQKRLRALRPSPIIDSDGGNYVIDADYDYDELSVEAAEAIDALVAHINIIEKTLQHELEMKLHWRNKCWQLKRRLSRQAQNRREKE